jgi:hypothetical protein
MSFAPFVHESLDFFEKSPFARKVSRKVIIGEVNFEIVDWSIAHRGCDDAVYQKKKNREVWERLTRGMCFIFADGDLIHVSAGNRKFGDEAGPYEADVPEGAVKVAEIYTTKENGAKMNLSMFEHPRIGTVVTVGSKNVHLVFRLDHSDEDLALPLYSEVRYGFVSKFARLINQHLTTKMSVGQRDSFICEAIDNGCNYNFEACLLTDQHLVSYERDMLIFFAITKYNESSNGLVAESPLVSIDRMSDLGFDVTRIHKQVPFSDVEDVSERDEIRDQFFKQSNSEGAVVYVVYRYPDGSTHVGFVYKYKNRNYVGWRAVREKMRARATLGDLENRLRRLHVEMEDYPSFEIEAKQFYGFCRMTVSPDEWSTLFSSWVTKKREFDLLDFEKRQKYLDDIIKSEEEMSQTQVMMISIPGIGKTSIMESLNFLCRKSGMHSVRLNQDEFGGNKKLFLKAIREKGSDQSYKVLLADKCHHNKRIREDTRRNMAVQNLVYVVCTTVPDSSPDVPALVSIATDRISSRGMGHLTLQQSGKVSGILRGFEKSYEPLTEEEASGRPIVYLNIDGSKEVVFREFLAKMAPYLPDGFTVPEDVTEALTAADEYETMVRTKVMKAVKTTFWSLQVPKEAVDEIKAFPEIISVMSESVNSGKTINEHLHCTLIYIGGKGDIDESPWMPLEGQTVPLSILGIGWDEKAVALIVGLSPHCVNPIPHMTFALSEGAMPKYSNEMLGSPDNNIFMFETPFDVPSVVTRNVSVPKNIRL